MREGDLISLSLFLVGKAMSEESTPDVKSGLVPEQVSPSNPPEESTPELDKIKGRLYGEVEKGMNEPNWELGLSTGYYLLNLACSGRIDVGLAPDYYYVWAGRSGSGKTMVNLAALAEASINPAFKKH